MSGLRIFFYIRNPFELDGYRYNPPSIDLVSRVFPLTA